MILLLAPIFRNWRTFALLNNNDMRFGKINIKLQAIVSCDTAFDSALFAE